MSDDKIVGLDGKPLVPSGTPPNYSPAVVSLLEELLAQARAGKITSVAVSYIKPDDSEDGMEFNMNGWAGRQVALLGCLARAMYALNRALDKDDKGEAGNG